MHTHTTPPLPASDARSQAIADLSLEYLDATPARREEIGETVQGLIDGRVSVLRSSHSRIVPDMSGVFL